MPTELIFQEVSPNTRARASYVLIRRPEPYYTRDRMGTIGKIRSVYAQVHGPKPADYRRELIGLRLELNGQDTLSMEEVAEVYLVMTGMMEASVAAEEELEREKHA